MSRDDAETAFLPQYRERDVRIVGRVAPALAGELRAAAARWSEVVDTGVPSGA